MRAPWLHSPRCSFYGTLPTAWGDVDSWPSLQNLYLSSNNFSGTLPAVSTRSCCLGPLRVLRPCGLAFPVARAVLRAAAGLGPGGGAVPAGADAH